MKKIYCFLFCFSVLTLTAQTNIEPLPPALSAIKESELKKDLFALASDNMRGRRAGTLDELRAAAWVAQQAREAGLEPAGADGTYFQFFPLYRRVVSGESSVKINDKELSLWKEAWETSPVEAKLEKEVTWIENMADTTASLGGKVVAMKLMPPSRMPAEGMSLWVYRYALSAIREQSAVLKRQNVAAIVFVADSTASSKIGFFGHGFEEGTYEIKPRSSRERQADTVPVILVSSDWAEELQQKGTIIDATFKIDEFTYPSANVVAKVPGTDAGLKEEYVLFSGHHDHDGIGVPQEGDSIWNGADDNASVSVALLAIGRAWKKDPGKRSALFVWHGAEERGLLGSRYFVENPPVEKSKIIAVLNGDMIGRNDSGSAALLGSIPPHRNSQELVDMAMAANREITKFSIDTSWDAASHPEFWYYRSDHLPYARADIPAIFFTTLLHPDYHTPKDEADRIDLEKLTKMTKWMYATGWKISQQASAPELETE
ncbi:M28 family peptidase [Zunongwangia sp. F363]|uniref:M28 family peptidase n=1 Tax=Autumnicola tepida TaxID=3075595 RepID=A0ABU3CF10_9FLAO|nr:M28 family peptidase [Zunongwangia sp. F363]MDT0644909.1 M28 family peptidase [Zunongwangia sp. F363]